VFRGESIGGSSCPLGLPDITKRKEHYTKVMYFTSGKPGGLVVERSLTKRKIVGSIPARTSWLNLEAELRRMPRHVNSVVSAPIIYGKRNGQKTHIHSLIHLQRYLYILKNTLDITYFYYHIRS